MELGFEKLYCRSKYDDFCCRIDMLCQTSCHASFSGSEKVTFKASLF